MRCPAARDPRSAPRPFAATYIGGVLKFFIVVAVFAAVTYLVTRMLQERAGGTPAVRRRPRRPSQPPRPIAPDDDMDFLRDLDRKRRQPKDPDDS